MCQGLGLTLECRVCFGHKAFFENKTAQSKMLTPKAVKINLNKDHSKHGRHLGPIFTLQIGHSEQSFLSAWVQLPAGAERRSGSISELEEFPHSRV